MQQEGRRETNILEVEKLCGAWPNLSQRREDVSFQQSLHVEVCKGETLDVEYLGRQSRIEDFYNR